jgi:hypothetical protein
MPRSRINPFNAVLGLVGFLFTITASSYCLFVLRGIRPESATAAAPHALEQLMNEYGVSLLIGELAVLAVATIGAVAVDHVDGLRIRRERQLSAAESKGDKP